jgi:acyl-CoA reductase-like NAD-dependent aldehyde dehydrogenase
VDAAAICNYAMSIDGRRVSTAERDPVIDPALGAPFADVPRANREHLDEAVAAAARASSAWGRDEAFRRERLAACAGALEAGAASIGRVLSAEQGKPLANAISEVVSGAKWLAYSASMPTPPEILQDDANKRITVVRRPLGVVAMITPWNYPALLLCMKLGPALLAGNTAVAKPSPYTPITALLIAEALREVLPAGVLNVVTGGAELGAQLATHPAVRKVSFTGSIATGKRIMEGAAPDLKRITLELGGNDAAIVLPDVDPEAVAKKLFWGAFANAGQICVGIKRLLLHDDVFEPIVERLVHLARSTRVGRGTDPGVELGPLNNRPQFDRIRELVDEARSAGASVVAGGEALDGPGYFYPPTILTGATPGMRLVDEEQFGTALPVLRFHDVDEAMAEANRTRFGLGASVWTADVDRGAALAARLEAGMVWVNQHIDVTPFAPFGGAKASGIGVEGGRWGYEDMSEIQVVNVRRG